MVARFAPARAARLLALCASIVVGWYGFSYQRDWFLFHMKRGSVMRDLNEFRRQVQATGLEMSVLGEVSYGDGVLPLWALRQTSEDAHAKTVCLLAGVHGNEPAGPQTMLALAKGLHDGLTALPMANYLLIPLVNPWGWQRDLRHNGSNRDIARQFVGGDAQEAASIKKALAAARCNVLVDLHEDRVRRDFYVLAYDEPNRAGLEQVVQAIGSGVGAKPTSRPTNGIEHIDRSSFDGIWLTTASLWARESGVDHAFIVEAFDGLPLEKRIEIQKAAVAGLVGLAGFRAVP